MLTGTDEHGQKIQTVAEKAGKTPQEYVDEMAEMAKDLWKKMHINYDFFLRTTEPRHEKAVQKIKLVQISRQESIASKDGFWYNTKN